MSYHDEVLAKYATAGLLRNTLTVEGKRQHLYANGTRGADAEKILRELYGEEYESQHRTDPHRAQDQRDDPKPG